MENKSPQKQQIALVIRWIVNVLGGLLTILLFIIPNTPIYLMLSALILPFIVMICLHFFGEFMRINDKRYSVALPLTLPGVALGIRVIKDFNIVDYSNLWFPLFMITVGSGLFLFTVSSEFKLHNRQDLITVLSVLCFICFYSYGGIIHFNVRFDETEPETFQTVVVEKQISRGNNVFYQLYLKPWGPILQRDVVNTAESLYQEMEVGDTLDINLYQGKLNIPWYRIKQRQVLFNHQNDKAESRLQ